MTRAYKLEQARHHRLAKRARDGDDDDNTLMEWSKDRFERKR